MFGENPFYHGTIKKCIVAFGNLFSDIHIRNFDTDGNIVRLIKCPISYSPKQQWYYRLREDPDFAKKFETELPRLAFEVISYQYNPDKKLGNQGNMILQNCGAPKSVYTPVPYRLTFELSSYTKNQEDALQILEQILPYFQPALEVNIIVLPEFNLRMGFPIIFNGVQHEDNYQDLQNNRMIIQTFTFNMDVQLFGPIDSSVGSVIKEAIVDVNTQGSNIDVTPETTYTAEVNPRSANKTDTYTIDEMWSPL